MPRRILRPVHHRRVYRRHAHGVVAINRIAPHIGRGLSLIYKAAKRGKVGGAFHSAMLNNFKRMGRALLPHIENSLVGKMVKKVIVPALKLKGGRRSDARRLARHHLVLHSIAHRAKKMRGGNRFTDFFKGVGNKIKDAFTKPVKLPDWAKKGLNFMRDKFNPALISGVKALSHIPIPLLQQAAQGISKAGDAYLKVMPPQGSGRHRRHRRHASKRHTR